MLVSGKGGLIFLPFHSSHYLELISFIFFIFNVGEEYNALINSSLVVREKINAGPSDHSREAFGNIEVGVTSFLSQQMAWVLDRRTSELLSNLQKL